MKEKKSCNNCRYLTSEIKCCNENYLDARANYRSTGKAEYYCTWYENRHAFKEYSPSKEYSLKEVLQLPDNTRVKDMNDNIYRVYEEDGEKYLFDTIISLSILNSKFTLV